MSMSEASAMDMSERERKIGSPIRTHTYTQNGLLRNENNNNTYVYVCVIHNLYVYIIHTLIHLCP